MGGQMLSIYIDAPAFYDRLVGEKAWMYWTSIAGVARCSPPSTARQVRPADAASRRRKRRDHDEGRLRQALSAGDGLRHTP